jgi:hypothetical protein
MAFRRDPGAHTAGIRGTGGVVMDRKHESGKPQPPSPRTRIDLDEPGQVVQWCAQLRCSESQLRDAVKRVGSTAARVEAYLR